MSETTGGLLQVRDRIQNKIEDEKARADLGFPLWSIYGEGAKSYDESFYPLLEKTLQQFVDERKQDGSAIKGMDLMGDGQVLRDLHIPGIAVTLVDGRNDEQKTLDITNGIQLIAGNILNKATWEEVKSQLRNNRQNVELPGVDLITCRPLGGLSFLPDNLKSYYVLLQRAWELLNTNGVLLTECPDSSVRILPEWSDRLNATGTIKAKYAKIPHKRLKKLNSYKLMLVKGENAPNIIPGLESSEIIE